jgi:hypothetical protein
MQAHTGQPHGLLQIVIPIVIILAVFAFRAQRLSRVRPLDIDRLWIVPLLYLGVTVIMFMQKLPSPLGWGLCVFGLMVGLALGWQRGKTMRIAVDPETGTLNQKGSIASILFIAVLVIVRQIGQQEGAAMHWDVPLIGQVLSCLALGMFTTMRVEMYMRSKRLLDEAGGVQAAA